MQRMHQTIGFIFNNNSFNSSKWIYSIKCPIVKSLERTSLSFAVIAYSCLKFVPCEFLRLLRKKILENFENA